MQQVKIQSIAFLKSKKYFSKLRKRWRKKMFLFSSKIKANFFSQTVVNITIINTISFYIIMCNSGIGKYSQVMFRHRIL